MRPFSSAQSYVTYLTRALFFSARQAVDHELYKQPLLLDKGSSSGQATLILQQFKLAVSIFAQLTAWQLVQVRLRNNISTMTLSKVLAASLVGVATMSTGALAQASGAVASSGSGGHGSPKEQFCKDFPDAQMCKDGTPAAPEDSDAAQAVATSVEPAPEEPTAEEPVAEEPVAEEPAPEEDVKAGAPSLLHLQCRVDVASY